MPKILRGTILKILILKLFCFKIRCSFAKHFVFKINFFSDFFKIKAQLGFQVAIEKCCHYVAIKPY